jgi:hypothetical protein
VLEHYNYLSIEEEKRQRTRVARPVIKGALLRWISKSEPNRSSTMLATSDIKTPAPTNSFSKFGFAYPGWSTNNAGASACDTLPSVSEALNYATHDQSENHKALRPLSSASDLHFAASPLLPTCRNFVVHEKVQYENASKPVWRETMSAMFGTHVQWEEVKVYTGKLRPLGV